MPSKQERADLLTKAIKSQEKANEKARQLSRALRGGAAEVDSPRG